MAFPRLNLPEYALRLRKKDDKVQVFDPIRRRFVTLTPEEWVRQNVVSHLQQALGYPTLRISNETAIDVNGLSKRCDTIVYDQDFSPLVIVEFKAPSIPLSQNVFDQVAVYNHRLEVPYLLLSNGMQHIFCRVSNDERKYLFYEGIPSYNAICPSN